MSVRLLLGGIDDARDDDGDVVRPASPNLLGIALDHRRPLNFVVAVDPSTDRIPDYTGSRWAPPCSVRSPTADYRLVGAYMARRLLHRLPSSAAPAQGE